MNKKRLKRFDIIIIIVLLAMLLINIAARLSTAFSDFYVQRIYPVISTPLVWLSGLFPFSLGELMMTLAVIGAIAGFVSLVTYTVVKRKNREAVKKAYAFAARLIAFAVAYIFTTETLGCFVMYQCTTFSERYFEPTEHTEELLLKTLSTVSERLAELSGEFERDSDGYIVLGRSYADECRSALKNISKDYSQLAGYYPKPKEIYFSFFMSQQAIVGLYIPFAFEATYNRDTQDISKPATICHELSHLKGIIQEDEANFVSMVACFGSDCAAVRYSGYLDAFYYLYSDAYELLGTDYEDALRQAISKVPDIVWDNDLYSFERTYWEDNKDKEIIPTETVQAVSEALTDANLKFNDVEEGIKIYYRVTELLMDYVASGGSI